MESYIGPGALLVLVGGALRLRPKIYREVAAQKSATKLCVAVVVLAGAASAPVIGPALGLVLAVSLVFGILLTLGLLGIEALITWGLCRVVLRESRTFGEVARPLAAAHAPRVLYLLVPVVGNPPIVGIVASVWLVAAFVVAMEAVARRGWGVAVAMALGVGVIRWLANAAIQGL